MTKILTSTLDSRRAHTRNNSVICSLLSHSIVFSCEQRVKRLSLHFAHYVRHIVITSVGNGCTKIGNLQWSKVHLTLTNRNTYNGKTIPASSIRSVVIVGIRNQTTFLPRQVNAKLITKAHAHHVIAPHIHGILNTMILSAITNHVIQSPAEITVARCA